MRTAILVSSCFLACAGALVSGHLSAQTPMSAQGGAAALRGPDAFASIGDSAQRSRALFAEAAKVITGPRCMNCHPAGDRPTQGNDMHEHQPPVFRGDNGVGVAGNTCSTCHT